MINHLPNFLVFVVIWSGLLMFQMYTFVVFVSRPDVNNSGFHFYSVSSNPFLTFFCFLPSRLRSRLMWLNSLVSLPRGPFTITVRPFSLTSTAKRRKEQSTTRLPRPDDDHKLQVGQVSHHCQGGPQSGCWEWSSFWRKSKIVSMISFKVKAGGFYSNVCMN